MLTNINETALTQNNFEKLLGWLNPDREIAGREYEAIRYRLTNIFQTRGCIHADELADETIDRVMQKIGSLQKNYQGDPVLFFYGVAKNVFREYLRTPEETPLSPKLKLMTKDTEELEKMDRYLSRSLKKLSSEQRRFILDYYTGSPDEKIKRRREMMQDYDITPEVMRIRAYRIRTKLQKYFHIYAGSKSAIQH